MANIVLLTHSTGGDVYPYIRLGTILKQHNHQVTLITHCSYESTARHAGLNFAAIDTHEEWDEYVNNNPFIHTNPTGNLQSVIDFQHKFENKQKILSEYKIICQHCNSKDTVLIARDRSSKSALLASEKLQIPLIVGVVSPYYLKLYQMEEEIFGDTIIFEINEIRRTIDLPPIASWVSWMKAAKRRIGFWPQWFADTRSWTIPATPVGFPLDVTAEPDSIPLQLQEILNSKRKSILIAGGTSKLLVHPEFFTCAIEACQLLDCYGIIPIRYKDLLPRNLPTQIKWFEYLPFSKVFPFMTAIIHHGGIGTASQAIVAGVPQVISPNYSDGSDTASILEQLGVAKVLPPVHWKPSALAKAISDVTAPNIQENCRKLSGRMGDAHLNENVVPLIEEVVGNRQFLLATSDFLANSPAIDLTEDSALAKHQTGSKHENVKMKDLTKSKRELLANMLYVHQASTKLK